MAAMTSKAPPPVKREERAARDDSDEHWVDHGEFEVMAAPPATSSSEEPNRGSAARPPKVEPESGSAPGAGAEAGGPTGAVTGIWAPGLGEAWPLRSDRANGRHGADSSRSQFGLLDGRPSKEAVLELCSLLPAHLARREPHKAATQLQRLYAWLWTGFASEVQAWLFDSGLHPALVAALASPGNVGRGVAFWACHVIGRAANYHSSNATAFIDAGAIEALSALVESRRGDAEVHLASACSLGYLVENGGAGQGMALSGAPPKVATLAIRAGAVSRVLTAIEELISDDLGEAMPA